MQWILLALAIVAEVIATSTLKSTEGFTRLWPSVVVVICYETALILLSLTLKRFRSESCTPFGRARVWR